MKLADFLTSRGWREVGNNMWTKGALILKASEALAVEWEAMKREMEVR